MVNDFAEIIKLLDSLGVKAIFAPIIAILTLLFLAKKYIFAGMAAFAKTAITEWLSDQKEKIKAELSIWEKLNDLDERFKIMQEALWDSRRYLEAQTQSNNEMMRQHVAETRTLILILKKKTDAVDETVQIDTQFFRQGGQDGNTSTPPH